jgi:DNA repair exonuclease SbcCD ATPase subunit
MNLFPVLLFALTASTLVLRTGERVTVDGPVSEENGVVVFRSAGSLYSMPAAEIDEEATRLEADRAANAKKAPVKRLRVTDEERRRLIQELEANHEGTPPTPSPILAAPPPAPSAAEVSRERDEEREWRSRARAHEEAVRQAREELQLLQERVEKLRSEIQTFFSLGFKPHQYTYQATQLEHALAEIPRAELEITRAERQYAEFREDARKEGILPGWLR